jgi:hypothetical protein
MPLGPQIVTYGNVQSTWVLTLTLTPVQTAIGTTAEQSFTVPGVQIGDQINVQANFAYSSQVTIANSRASAANTVAIAFANTTAGALTAPTGIYQIEVNRPLAGMTMTAIQ